MWKSLIKSTTSLFFFDAESSSTTINSSSSTPNDCNEYDITLFSSDGSPNHQCNTQDSHGELIQCNSDSFKLGSRFGSVAEAKIASAEFAKVPLSQSSTKKQKYIQFMCFRAGAFVKKQSKVDRSQQRNTSTRKCECPFEIRLKRGENDQYEVYSISGTHNHALYSEDELAEMPQNRFIPDDIREKMLELHSLGALTPSQVMLLIEKEHFPTTPVTWTKRDVQNLFQSVANRSHEALELYEMLQRKKDEEGWSLALHLNRETLRLERVLWVSKQGAEIYGRFHDVVELDATYRTNRFGMPLVLVTGIDNNGVTTLVSGCLLSDETRESYLWFLRELHSILKVPPGVVFTDGDNEIARAISETWPETVHLLCRFHIAQNIVKKLSGKLGSALTDFLDDFWRVGSIEELDVYNAEFRSLFEKWELCQDYLRVLEEKQRKWAFAYTHCNFVAGVASTQRQESVNFQVKSDLISNSTLGHLLRGFEGCEKKIEKRIIKATLRSKMTTAAADPMIASALEYLTNYAGALLKEEATLSLSYTCTEDRDAGNLFDVSHKDLSLIHICLCRRPSHCASWTM